MRERTLQTPRSVKKEREEVLEMPVQVLQWSRDFPLQPMMKTLQRGRLSLGRGGLCEGSLK